MPQHLRILGAAVVELLIAALVPFAIGLPLAVLGILTLAIGLAVWRRAPGLLGKRADGTFPIWSYVLFGHWHLVTRGIAHFVRREAGDAHFSEVSKDLVVGGWPHRSDTFANWPAILDVTAELPRRGGERYRTIPVWDHTAPSVEQIGDAVEWIRSQTGPVLIHCAHGRGRSATIAAAALIDRGEADSPEQALRRLQERRPATRVTPGQRAALADWQERIRNG